MQLVPIQDRLGIIIVTEWFKKKEWVEMGEEEG